MVKRLFLLSLMVLALCGASSVIALAGGAPGGPSYMPADLQVPRPCVGRLPPTTLGEGGDRPCSRATAQGQSGCSLPRGRGLAAYSACLLWQPQTFPNPIALGRYEWLVPAVEIKNEHFDTFMDPCCKTHKVPRCVYVKANYVKMKPVCGPVPMAPPPPMPSKVKK